MTAERVPEHPGWRWQWIRYAEYEGRRLLLHREGRRFSVCNGWHDLGRIGDPANTVRVYATCSSLPEAEAAFERACERLREGA